MSSKFYGLKGKLNKINKEVKEKAVEKAEAASNIEDTSEYVADPTEISNLLESLNTSATMDEVVEAATPPIELAQAPQVDPSGRNQMSHIAYNIYWDEVERAYGLCTIEYNLSRNEARIVETKRIADNPAVSLHKLNGLISLKLLKKEEVY